jgi:hypothetical protein
MTYAAEGKTKLPDLQGINAAGSELYAINQSDLSNKNNRSAADVAVVGHHDRRTKSSGERRRALFPDRAGR